MRFASQLRSALGLAVFALGLASAPACNLGGLNDGLRGPGDQPGGVTIAAGDVAVSPDGKYIVFARGEELAVAWIDTGRIETLPVRSPSRVAFSKQRDVVYATSELGQVHAVDLATRSTLWSVDTEMRGDLMVVASKTDGRVAVAGSGRVALFEAESGAGVAEHRLEREVVDLEILPDDERLLAVEREAWIDDRPSARVFVISLDDGGARTIDVPNCADDIQVPAGGKVALLAPTFCQQDPISHLDLEPGQERFVKNLPGFGPVALSPDGTTAVGFLDLGAIDESMFDDPAQIPAGDARYHLMIIDTETMAYDFEAYGDALPRYAPAPNGELLLVDSFFGLGAELFDLKTRSFRPVTGIESVDVVAFTSSSKDAYVLSDARVLGQETWAVDYALFHLDVDAAEAASLTTDFRPRNLNLSVDDATLFLRVDEETICVYSIERQRCDRRIVLGPVAKR